jgi:ribosomal protein S27AE
MNRRGHKCKIKERTIAHLNPTSLVICYQKECIKCGAIDNEFVVDHKHLWITRALSCGRCTAVVCYLCDYSLEDPDCNHLQKSFFSDKEYKI